LRRSAKQLQQLLQDATGTASGCQDSSESSFRQASQRPGLQENVSFGQAAGLTAASGLAGGSAGELKPSPGQKQDNGQGAGVAASVTGQPAAAAAVGPAVMVGGRLVAANVLQQQQQQMPRRRRRHDGEHREKLIKKFSAKTQVSWAFTLGFYRAFWLRQQRRLYGVGSWCVCVCLCCHG
jgi:hypothetical protein